MTDLECRQEAQLKAQAEALAHWRREVDRLTGEIVRLKEQSATDLRNEQASEPALKNRVHEWVMRFITYGETNLRGRASRILWDAAALAKAEGIDKVSALDGVNLAYARMSGPPVEKAGRLAANLLMYCAASGTTLEKVALLEFERIDAIDQKHAATRKAMIEQMQLEI